MSASGQEREERGVVGSGAGARHQARTTTIRRPCALVVSRLAVRASIGGWPLRRSKITSQPQSSPRPAR